MQFRLTIDFEKERTGHCEEKKLSACRLYNDQIYNCNLEISPTPAIIKRNCHNGFFAFKSYKPPKNTTATVVKGGALGLSIRCKRNLENNNTCRETKLGK
jgi:hypothetical protein